MGSVLELSILLASLSPIEVKCELKASAIADAFVTSLSGSLISLTVAALLVLRELRDHSLFMTGGGLAKKGGGS